MSKASGRGKTGEDHVCGYLEKHGWKIAARNYRVKGGEIDIVAEKNGIIAFVEVKTRKFGSLSDGIEAVDVRKQRCIVRAADRYIETFPAEIKEVRFDAAVVTVTTDDIPRVLEMKYFESAFDAFGL